MTEDEAKKKVCKQLPIYDELGICRETDYLFCIASNCMMWRWIQEYDGDFRFGAPRKELPLTKGYCGLGGRP